MGQNWAKWLFGIQGADSFSLRIRAPGKHSTPGRPQGNWARAHGVSRRAESPRLPRPGHFAYGGRIATIPRGRETNRRV